MNTRRGIAVPLVLTMGGVLALMVFGVMKYSGQEIKWVSRLMDGKQAEYLAYAGINYATQRLNNEGRWYQPPDGSPKDAYLSFAMTEEEPFGKNNGKFYVVCLETTRKIVCKEHPLYEKYTTPEAPNGFIEVNVVSSINIYSLGVKGEDRCLMFSRLIMSPEPVARSRSTNAPGTGNTTGAFAPNEFTITMSPDVPQAEPDGAIETQFKVTDLLIPVGKQIQGNERIVRLLPATTVSTKEFFPCAEVDGKIKTWLVKPGDIVKVGSPLAVMETESGTAVPSTTLKKTIQITRIDLRKHEKNVKGFNPKDLENVDFLKKIWNDVDANFKEAFTRNYRNVYTNETQFQSQLETLEQKTDLTQEDVERLAVTGGSGGAESEFIMSMFRSFYPPNQGIDPDSNEAKQFPGSARFNLSHRPRNLKSETEEACRIFSDCGGDRFKQDLEATIPKTDSAVCLVPSTEGFIGKMKSVSTQGFSEEGSPESIIEGLTFLKKAKSKGSISWVNGTPWETKELAIANAPNGASYREVPSKKGWYPPPNFGKVDYGDAYYTYENGALKLRVDYILNFIKKHYGDDGNFPTGKDLRLGADQEDQPQKPGPPDITGRRTSDGC
jgi:hypothetical protein